MAVILHQQGLRHLLGSFLVTLAYQSIPGHLNLQGAFPSARNGASGLCPSPTGVHTMQPQNKAPRPRPVAVPPTWSWSVPLASPVRVLSLDTLRAGDGSLE